MAADDETELVRRGYNASSYYYRHDDAGEGHYGRWLADLTARLPAGADVLDLGCGCGVPVARSLAASGYRVTGVDISEVQIERARRLVPAGTFVRADATQVAFSPASFHAIVCLYALIHMPLAAQPHLLRRAASWLRPAGWLLAITGHRAWTGTEDNWLGGPAPMWWSHADAATYRSWLEQAGLQVTAQEFVPERDGGHMLFRARIDADRGSLGNAADHFGAAGARGLGEPGRNASHLRAGGWRCCIVPVPAVPAVLGRSCHHRRHCHRHRPRPAHRAHHRARPERSARHLGDRRPAAAPQAGHRRHARPGHLGIPRSRRLPPPA